jgi:glycosyltransferase involved in cell wall biosynthesis
MPSPLRIAVASSGLGHVARGVEAWAQDLAAALADRGEAVTLYKGGGTADRAYERVVPCLRREDRLTRRLLGVVPGRLGWRIGLGSGYQAEQTTFAANLVRHLRREPADVLHVQDSLVARLAQRARRLRLIRTRTILAHGTEESPAFLRRIEYLQHLAPWHQEAVRQAGVHRPTWTAIPNFIDTERFTPGRGEDLRAELGIPADGLVVLSVAAIKCGHKRVDHLIGEFARLLEARPHVPAYLVVAGGWEADTDDLVAEGTRRLGDRVRFLVRFPRARMPELYRAADVFALASLFEMMPIALIEATASGLPCVVNRHPVLEWMVGPGGEAIDMAAPGELAAALGRLAADPVARAGFGARAREQCVREFSRAAVVDRMLAYYRFVAADRGARKPACVGGPT